jgi:hypothetical protein
MESRNHKKLAMHLVGMLLIGLLILLSTNIFAQANQEQDNKVRSLTKAEAMNYLKGLNSDNDGLRKSCIYFAGKYKITEAVDILKEQLSEEENPETSVLIVLALYEILEKNVLSNIDEEN